MDDLWKRVNEAKDGLSPVHAAMMFINQQFDAATPIAPMSDDTGREYQNNRVTCPREKEDQLMMTIGLVKNSIARPIAFVRTNGFHIVFPIDVEVQRRFCHEQLTSQWVSEMKEGGGGP